MKAPPLRLIADATPSGAGKSVELRIELPGLASTKKKAAAKRKAPPVKRSPYGSPLDWIRAPLPPMPPLAVSSPMSTLLPGALLPPLPATGAAPSTPKYDVISPRYTVPVPPAEPPTESPRRARLAHLDARVAHLATTPSTVAHNGVWSGAIRYNRTEMHNSSALDGFRLLKLKKRRMKRAQMIAKRPKRKKPSLPKKTPKPVDWLAVAALFPNGRDAKAIAKRKDLFAIIDTGGDGTICAQEAIDGIDKMIKRNQIDLQGFDMCPVIEAAMDAAQMETGGGTNEDKTEEDDDDDEDDEETIDRNEFRLMLCYLRWYFELLHMYEQADSGKGDDGMLSKDEFMTLVDPLKAWGADVSNIDRAWGLIDHNKTANADFADFLAWAIGDRLNRLKDPPDPEPPPPPHVARQINWKRLTTVLPATRDRDDKMMRKILFKEMDHDGQGVLTYREVESGIIGQLMKVGAKNVLALKPKPAIKNAFVAASMVHQERRGKTCQAPSLKNAGIEPIEFRLMLAYLRYYFELYAIFQEIDDGGSDDGLISLDEFKKMFPKLLEWGADVKDGPEAAFRRLDEDGSGGADFGEFLAWALKHQLDRDDDDDEDDDQEETLAIGTGIAKK